MTEEYTVSAVPAAIKAKAVSGEGSITLSLEAVAGATKYAVSVIDEDGDPVILSNRVTDTAFKADNLTSGKIYTYEIMAYNGRSWQSVTDEYTVSMIAG